MSDIGHEWIRGAAEVAAVVAFWYVGAVLAFYLLQLAIAMRKLAKEEGLAPLQLQELQHSAFTPPLSILVPAYNEERNIVDSVRSLLGINYGLFEIIVVNDGSKDRTVEEMLREFDMFEIRSKSQWSELPKTTQPVRRVFGSKRHANLFLVDKANGGKADALNAGILYSRYPYFVSLDGDTVLDPDAFVRIMKPILEARPGEEIIATGGSIGIVNGSGVDSGYLRRDDVRLSGNPLVAMQVIEYLRAFLMGRIALSEMRLLLIVSGAFGVFRKDWVIEAGGYETGTIGEDMELVVRLHRLIREKRSQARIAYIPDPVCWTEAPETLAVLKRQRSRWQRGLFESLWKHRGMLFRPKYGRIGLAAMPYFLIVELFGPIVELAGYAAVVFGYFLGALNIGFVVTFALLILLYGSLLSAGTVLLEELSLKKYNRVSDVTKLFLCALTESLWYRPLMLWFRLVGLVEAIRGKKHGWGDMARRGISVRRK
ncbi:glycosyltransferase family 2 protein [Paenibacillus sp.]|uniref:glycosyltransferase family 2 protein n=1 Tax=Paenibacillus sp. TaxID=58172 RepID=UPI002D31DF5D|nr:glycosyltransferase [Paenibacillus sp.]HZG56071.1 glycosyltransferase [Paenibacillus sp.]